jgi:hypothetical protein
VNKQRALDWAELIDSYRIYPRLFLAACFFWTVEITHILLNWYMSLPKEERGLEASGFASVVFVTAFGFLKLVYQTYSDAGRDWSQQIATHTSTSTQTTVVTPP